MYSLLVLLTENYNLLKTIIRFYLHDIFFYEFQTRQNCQFVIFVALPRSTYKKVLN